MLKIRETGEVNARAHTNLTCRAFTAIHKRCGNALPTILTRLMRATDIEEWLQLLALKHALIVVIITLTQVSSMTRSIGADAMIIAVPIRTPVHHTGIIASKLTVTSIHISITDTLIILSNAIAMATPTASLVSTKRCNREQHPVKQCPLPPLNTIIYPTSVPVATYAPVATSASAPVAQWPYYHH